MSILARFKRWKTPYIFAALIVISIIFVYIPPTQSSLNRSLYWAVVRADYGKAKSEIEAGAQRNILLPNHLPLISLAIESNQTQWVALLLDESIDLNRTYAEGYRILEHAKEKGNPAMLQIFEPYVKQP